MDIAPISARPELTSMATSQSTEEMQEAAKAFEAVFVKQMLQYAGLADAFGMSEDSPTASFADFILEKVAEDMVDQGGFGLADQFYDYLKAQSDDAEGAATTRTVY